MVFLWAGVLFIFLFTVPKQETPEQKVWRELEESIIVKQKPEEKVKDNRRLRIKDIDWDKVDNATKNTSSGIKTR